MDSSPVRDTSRAAARLAGAIMAAALAIVFFSIWMTLSYTDSNTGHWPSYGDMMAALPSPMSWLRWVLGDITEVAFYKHELASFGLLLGAALG